MSLPVKFRNIGLGGACLRLIARLPIIGALALLGALVASPSGGVEEEDRGAQTTPPAMTISVTAARRESVPRRVTATGTVTPWQELTLGAQTTGLAVIEVKVQENDLVRTGDVLVRFDSRALVAQIAQEKAAVAEAQATLDSAKDEGARGDALVLQKALSLEAAQTRRTAVRTSQAKLDQALAALDQFQTALDLTVVRAPSDGVVSQEPIKLGAVPQAGTELLRLIRDDRLEVQVKVPERELEQIEPDQAAIVTRPNGKQAAGQVREVAVKVDAATRLGTVYVSLSPRSRLRPGMFANVEVTVGEDSGVTIPEQALVWSNGKTSAFVVSEDGSVRLTKLATSGRHDGRIAVEAGLQEGERVAVAGAGFLHDGDTVRVEPALVSSGGEANLQ